MRWNKATTKLPEIGKRYMICEEGCTNWMEGFYYKGFGKYTVEGWYTIVHCEGGGTFAPLHGTGSLEKVWYTNPRIPARIRERI